MTADGGWDLTRRLKGKSLPVTLRTTRFNNQQFYIVITWNLCALYGSRNKQQICLTQH
jgi:hypothetical protein